MNHLRLQFFDSKFYFTVILLFIIQVGFAQTNLITNGDFENGTTGWSVWGATMTISSDAHGGNSSVLIANRKNPWDALVRDVKSLLVNGESYTIGAWVKIPKAAVNFRITLGLQVDGVSTYTSLCRTESPRIGSYEFYTQNFEVNWNGNLQSANIYIETESVNGEYSDYLADDIFLEKYVVEPDAEITGEGFKDVPGSMLIGGCVGGIKNYFNNETAKAQVLKDCNAMTITCYPAWGRWDENKRHVYHVEDFSNKIREMKKQDMNVTAHMLLGWDQYFPDWFKNNDFPADTLDAIMKSWLKAIITYEGNDTLVDVWNVVNEAISWNGKGGYWPLFNANHNDACEMQRMGNEPDASGLTGTQFVNTQHPVYIRKAFEYARTLTDKKLELRDSGFEFPGDSKYNAFYQLAKHLKELNVPVDVIGFQTHLDIERTYDWEAYANNIKRYVKLGYEVNIPEVDIGDVKKDWSEEKAELQKKQYYNLITAAIRGGASQLQTWGFIDNNETSWRLGESAFPYANNFEQKPAYFGIKEALIDMSSILFWEMDATVNNTMPDVMKYNNFGALNNINTPVFVKGFKKNAFQFDGIDDYISTGILSDSVNGDLTFSCFFKTGTVKAGIIVDLALGENSGLKIGINAQGKIILYAKEAELSEDLESPEPVNDNVWHFVAVQRDSNIYRLYVDDSAPVATGEGSMQKFNKLTVGAKNDGNDSFEGVIDEVKLYDSAIEEESFKRNYLKEDQLKLGYIYRDMRVKLTWTDNNNDNAGYVVDRKIGYGNWVVAGDVNAGVLQYYDNLDLYDTTYFYRVRSAARFLNSGASNEVSVQTPNNPNTVIANDMNQLPLSVYPNPVNDKFSLHCSENVSIRIYDIHGKLMLEKNKVVVSETIDISDFQNGVFFLQALDGERIKVLKLIKN